MKFWKFECEDGSAVVDCINNGSLPSQETGFPGLKNTFAHPLKAMRVGDGVVLATLKGNEARIFAVGKVQAIESDVKSPSIQWAATRTTLFPDPRGGLVNWQTKTAFEISPEPAKRYGLQKLIDYYVRTP